MNNSRTHSFKLHAISLAVLASMSTQLVYAQEDEAAALKMPTNTIDMGLTYVPVDSTRFGEYNGLQSTGTRMNGGFQLRGGPGYGQNEQGATERWSLSGDNLGLSSRSMKASRGSQGEWSVSVDYDEMRHYTTSNYSTPYSGALGGNVFTVGPLRNGTTGAALGLMTPATAAAFSTLTIDPNYANQSFTPVDVYTERRNTGLTATRTIDSRLSLSFDYNQLAQSGAKLMPFASAANQIRGGTVSSGQFIALLPNPTNYRTDTMTLSLNWLGEKSNLTASYHGSFFRDGYQSVRAANFAADPTNASGNMQTWSTAPDNDFHQLSVTGGHVLSSQTKLTGGFSYSRNTQNQAYAGTYDSFMYGTGAGVLTTPPVSSLGGVVVTTHADMKLTHKASQALTWSGAFKYDDRNNQTASNLYSFYAINSRYSSTNTQTTDYANYANVPLSTRKTQLDLTGDYRLGTHQYVRMGYVHSSLDRKCHQYAESANCVVATSTKEDKLELGYRDKVLDGLGYRVGYGYNVRKTESDPTAITPMVGTNGGFVLATKTAGTVEGLNAGDYPGFYPAFNATRNQHVLKIGTQLQLDSAWAFSLGGRYTNDQYPDSNYGVQNGKSASLSADLAYTYSEAGSAGLFAIKQNRTRMMNNYRWSSSTSGTVVTQSGGVWANELSDSDVSFGLNFKHTGIARGSFDLEGELSQTVGLTRYTTTADNAYSYTKTTAGVLTTSYTGCTAANAASSNGAVCGSSPDIRNAITTLRLTGTYHLDKQSRLVARVMSQKLDSADYLNNGYQATYVPSTILPTNQTTGGYHFNVVSMNYVQQF
jgi:MtrB/PioB family decaheme-associated outer membrane protein